MASWHKSSFSFSNGNCVEVAGDWRKSSASMSDGHCAEVGAWRKSARCQTGECAEVGQDGAVVGVRDSQLAESPVLTFGAASWRAFILQVKRG
jgi:hypothetical protein